LAGGILPWNLTMTRAPRLNNSFFDFQFDGRFVKPQNDTKHQQAKLEPLPSDYINNVPLPLP